MPLLIGLGVAAAVLLGLGAATARRPDTPVPTFAEYLRRWSALHGSYDAASSTIVRGWLRLTYAVSRPFAALGVAPDVLTAVGLLVTGGVVALAAAGGRWAILAGAVVVGSGLADSLDGAVAVLTDRATRFGYVLDSVVDRVSDAGYLLALHLVGADGRLCVGAGLALGLLEYTRARAGNAGMGEIGVVTVGERGTRIAVAAAALATAGVYVPVAAAVVTIGAAVTLGLSLAGLGQLLVVVRRVLAG